MEILIPAIRKNKPTKRTIHVELVDDDTRKLPVLVIAEKYKTTRYTVEEIYADVGFDGRAFRVCKLDSHDRYNVLICNDGIEHTCDCPGFEKAGYCKHVAAIDSLVTEGKLNEPCSDRELDQWPAEC